MFEGQIRLGHKGGFKSWFLKLKFMLTILKMIHIYIYNKRWNQNLREIEGKEKWISDLPRLSSDSREEKDEPENPLKMSPNPSLDDVSPKVLMYNI